MIKKIVIHCADTPPSRDVDAAEIKRWHLARGWSDIGYHFVIKRGGIVETGRDLSVQGAHVAGHNKDTVGVCLAGGYLGKFDYTRAQLTALERVIEDLLIDNPEADVCGHTDLDPSKTCPNFNVREWWYNR